MLQLTFSLRPIYVLAIAVILFLVVGNFMAKKNKILKGAGNQTAFTAYNQKKRDRSELIGIWRNDQKYFNAVRSIVYLDFVLMLIFGTGIFYGLWIAHLADNPLQKQFSVAGMVMIVVAVLFDALQDTVIYQHLVNDRFIDVRSLTTPKFLLIGFSLLILVISILREWRLFSSISKAY
jgi:hypothetical protein